MVVRPPLHYYTCMSKLDPQTRENTKKRCGTAGGTPAGFQNDPRAPVSGAWCTVKMFQLADLVRGIDDVDVDLSENRPLNINK